MAKTQRTDPHRPGAIIPAHYDHWNSYSLAHGLVPAIGVDCSMPYPTYDAEGRVTGYVHPKCPDSGRCCVASTHRHAHRDGRAVFGGIGKCGVCGAHYVYGSMFRHELTGAIVHMGHDCADKYEAMYDLSAWQLAHDRAERAVAKAVAREANDKARATFLAKHPGLEDALALGNASSDSKGARILADLAAKFITYRTMSDKQVAFAFKLADEIKNPAPAAPAEIKIAAPTGKGVEFEGEIVSAKIVESQWGSNWKLTIKVTTDAGVWLAWGTMPSSFYDLHIRDAANDMLRTQTTPAGEHVPSRARDLGSAIMQTLKGLRVEVKATLEASKGSERTCEYCCGSGQVDETDYVKGRDGKWSHVPRKEQCGSCKGTGVVGRKADPSFAFMSRPSMTIAGRVLHPMQRKPRKAKAAPADTKSVDEAEQESAGKPSDDAQL